MNQLQKRACTMKWGYLFNRDIHAEKNTWPWYKVGRKMCFLVPSLCYADKMLEHVCKCALKVKKAIASGAI